MTSAVVLEMTGDVLLFRFFFGSLLLLCLCTFGGGGGGGCIIGALVKVQKEQQIRRENADSEQGTAISSYMTVWKHCPLEPLVEYAGPECYPT